MHFLLDSFPISPCCVDHVLLVFRYLYGFEEYCRSASITFRTIHHNNPRPPSAVTNQLPMGTGLKEPCTPIERAESVDDKMEEAESDSESEKEVKERQSSPRVRDPSVL